MKILVTGPDGFVGKHVMKAIPEAIAVPKLRGGKEEVTARVKDADVIIHTAAVARMALCEADPEAAYKANVLLPIWIAEAAPKAKLFMLSSDQVYNNSKEKGPFKEDMTCPGNVYSRLKAEMEQKVLALAPSAVMLRATWMFDKEWGYLANMRSSQGDIIVPDQYRAVTYIREVAENIAKMVKMEEEGHGIRGGIYNFGSETDLHMMPLMQETAKLMGLPNKLVLGERSRDLWMDCSALRAQGISFCSSIDGIKRCLQEE